MFLHFSEKGAYFQLTGSNRTGHPVGVAYLWVQDEIRSQRLRVRRVRSEENVADLGTKPLSKTVIAKHCLTLGFVNMDEESVQSGWQIVAMFWDFGSAVSSQRQAAGDHVQKSASRDPQQQKQLQDSQQRDFRKFSQGEHMRVHPRQHHHSRRRTLPLHGAHDKSLQSIMKCDDDIHENFHDGVMSFNDTDALQGIGERTMKDRNAV